MKNTDYYDMILTGEQKTMLFQKKNPLFTYIFTVIFSVSILIQASFPVLAAPEETPDATGLLAERSRHHRAIGYFNGSRNRYYPVCQKYSRGAVSRQHNQNADLSDRRGKLCLK